MTSETISSTDPARGTTGASLRTNRDFRHVFAAGAVSKIGTQVSYLAVPLVAVSALNASPGEVGVLATVATLAWLLVGLPAGALVDRLRRQRLMILADLVRAALFATVPLAWWLDRLTMAQLYAVVFAAGIGTVFFDVAHQSMLPSVVSREALIGANTRLVGTDAVVTLAGRSAGGVLVQAFTAPMAIVVDAVSYVASAALLTRIGGRGAPPSAPARTRWRAEVGAGIRYVFGHAILRPIVLAGAATNLSMQLIMTMLPIVFVGQLGLSEAALGTFLAAGGLGACVGAMAAQWIGRRLGPGPAMWIVAAITGPFAFVVPLVDGGVRTWLAAAAWVSITVAIGVDNVLKVTFRQRCTPDGMLGRMNATFRFVLTGALAIGAALAGVVGEMAGPRTVLWLGAIGLATSWLIVFASPLRRMHELPAEPECS